MSVLPEGLFSPQVRREEKKRSRAHDQFRLESGQISGRELAQQNSMVSALNPARARIVRRRVSVDISACRQQGG
jgi:hypothetical protein